MKLIKAITNNIESKWAKYKKYRAIGLNYIRVKYLKHAVDDNVKTYNLYEFNIRYTNGPDFLHSLEEIFIENVYKFNAAENPYIIDCGANIGLSILYFHKFYPGATIIGYEPDELNFKLLTDNIKQLNSDKIQIYKEAIWINNGYINFENTGGLGSKISNNENLSVKVKAKRLGDLLVKKVDLLKIDIEGAEYDVLKDIKEGLHWVERVFIEYHGRFSNQNELLELFDIIYTAGFSFYIKEALDVYTNPFYRKTNLNPYEIQLNIFCFKITE